MKRFCLLLGGVLLMVDCGGGGGGSGPPMITAVAISGDSTVVLAGTRQLTATAMSGGTPVSTGVTFQWLSSDTTRATVSGSGSSGTVSGVRLGSTTITARAVLNGTPTSIVSSSHGIRTRIGAIVISPSTPQFTALHDSVPATAQARDALNAAVPGVRLVWQSRTPSVASIADSGIGSQVFVVAQTNGTSRVIVTGDGVSDSVTATVQQVATSLSITPDTVTFGRIDSTLTPAITASDSRGNAITGSALTWSTQNSGVATVNPASGVIQSKNEGQSRVIGTSGALADTVRVGVRLVYKSVEITSSGALPASIDSAVINRKNGSLQLGLIVRDSGNTIVPSPQGIAWSLKTGAIATIGAATGLITGNTNTGRDTIVLVARTARDSAPLIVRQDIATVAVTPASPTDLNFVGDTQRFVAVGRDAGGSDIPALTFTWTTNNVVLGIDAGGLATAAAATSQTGVLVRVRAATGGITDSSVSIRVKQVPVSATLSPNSFSTLTAFGQQVTASCVVRDSGTVVIPSHLCAWTAVPDTGVVSFSPLTAVTTTITARKNGDANIRAVFFQSLFAPNFVQVQQAPARVTLHPTTLDTSRIVITTGTMRFVDSVFDANDSLIRTPAPSITWSSSGAAASVDAAGLVTASGSAGNAFIKAVSGTGRDSARIEVVAAAITLSAAAQPIFTANCSGCHSGPTSSVLPSGQNLSAGTTRANTVNIQSIESALKRILPSRPDSSYLVHKVQGTHLTRPASGSGEQMPLGGPFLTKGQINLIRNWILQGALNN